VVTLGIVSNGGDKNFALLPIYTSMQLDLQNRSRPNDRCFDSRSWHFLKKLNRHYASNCHIALSNGRLQL
jgi:hypothetical protein